MVAWADEVEALRLTDDPDAASRFERPWGGLPAYLDNALASYAHKVRPVAFQR